MDVPGSLLEDANTFSEGKEIFVKLEFFYREGGCKKPSFCEWHGPFGSLEVWGLEFSRQEQSILCRYTRKAREFCLTEEDEVLGSPKDRRAPTRDKF
jgi:hypothetical protein